MKYLPLVLGLGLSAVAVLVVPGSGANASMQSQQAIDRPHAVASKYLDQKPQWVPCGEPEYRTSCAKIVVPRDWANQYAGNDLRIAVSKVAPAKGKPSRVVFGNPGGPGAAGLGMAPFLATQASLAKDHLAVGFDPRGTGGSTNVSCDGTPGYTMDARDRDPGTRDLITEASELAQPYCERQSRDLLPYITTAQTVQDMDLIRRLLGFDTIDYVGYSGGTWLGAYYQTYFPTHVGRFVLDSNTDFTKTWLDTFVSQPQSFERRFREDFATWAARYDDRLHLGSSAGEVVRRYERLRRTLKAHPATEEFLEGAVTLTYDQNTLDQMVTNDLYSKLDFPFLAADLRFLVDLSAAQAKGGPRAAQRHVNALPMARQQQLVRRAGRTPIGLRMLGAEDAEDATFTAITCNDTPWPQGREYGEQLAARLGPHFPLTGWTMNENPCFYWQRPNLTMPTPTGKGLPTTLMVQSVHDPATSYSLAASAHSRYAGSRLVTVTGEGDHGIYGGVNRCADRIVDTFLSTGVAPAQDVSCAGEGIPAPPAAEPDLAPTSGGPLRTIAGFTKAISGYLP